MRNSEARRLARSALLSPLRALETEAVQRAVVRADVDASVRDGQPREMTERGDLIAARIHWIAGLSIEDIQGRVGRFRRPNSRIEVEPDIGKRLFRLFPAPVAKYQAVGDHHGLT